MSRRWDETVVSRTEAASMYKLDSRNIVVLALPRDPGHGTASASCRTSLLVVSTCHTNAAGSLIMASSGPVLGLQDCPVVLPNVLPEFRQTCQQLASAQQELKEQLKSDESEVSSMHSSCQQLAAPEKQEVQVMSSWRCSSSAAQQCSLSQQRFVHCVF